MQTETAKQQVVSVQKKKKEKKITEKIEQKLN